MTPHLATDLSTSARQSVKAGEAGSLIVYFDGSCPLCSAEIGHYERQDGSEWLCFVDVSDANADTGADLKPTTAMRRFHVRQSDGQLLSGSRAFVAIWQLLPLWRPAARLAALPGVITVLEIVYRLFLPIRPLMSRVAAVLGARPRRVGPMQPTASLPLARLLMLTRAALNPPPGPRRILLALALGIAVHTLFSAAVLAMVVAMWFGMSKSLGAAPEPWGWPANLLLLFQFPLAHSLLLTRWGERILARLLPGPHGVTLLTTNYALIASAQLLALFALWTPSGVVWWRAEGSALWLIGSAYSISWLLLIKASYDAGAEVQSGALGWMSLLAARRPVFPDMPIGGLFRIIRQPIYAAFALTLWTVPVWTPDQLVLAGSYTLYCLLAPLSKERRFAARYGERFHAYRAKIPYIVPRLFSRPQDRSDA